MEIYPFQEIVMNSSDMIKDSQLPDCHRVIGGGHPLSLMPRSHMTPTLCVYFHFLSSLKNGEDARSQLAVLRGAVGR